MILDRQLIIGRIIGYSVILQNHSDQLRCLPPPRRAPRGGFNNRKNLGDFPAIDPPAEQVIHRTRNRGMPTQRGQSPQERRKGALP
jgi:hypothetical protein